MTFIGKSLTLKRDGLPAATISVDSALSIDGKPVDLNQAQRQAMRSYYAQVQGVAKKGIDIGTQGAAFGAHAAGEAIRGVLSGNSDQMGDKIEAEADTFSSTRRCRSAISWPRCAPRRMQPRTWCRRLRRIRP